MAISDITPLYTFISTGEKTMMYTLKEMCSVVAYIDGHRVAYNDSFYIQNLSTDKEEANKKANDLSASMGLPFRANAEFDLNEIKRRKAGEAQAEKEARELIKREYQERIAKEFSDKVGEGFMVCGKYTGLTAQQIVDKGDKDYILYCASQAPKDGIQVHQGVWAINCQVAALWLSENPQRESQYVGIEGDTVELSLTLRYSRVCSGQYRTILFVCETEDGDLVKFFSTAKGFCALEDGDCFRVKATIKKHEVDYYMTNDPKTTLLARPKIIS